MLILGLHLHLHLHLIHHPGAAIDYIGLAGAAVISWIAGIGPGEPALIAAGVFAAKHKLDISPVVFWAWIGAIIGGTIGWLIGLRAGRSVLTAPGPLHKLRVATVARGEQLFKRHEVLAIVLTPPWVAGVNRSRAKLYLPINVLQGLLLWAIPLGVGSYYIGPPVLDVFNDAGTFASGVVGLIVAAGVVGALLRRRRAARRATSGSSA